MNKQSHKIKILFFIFSFNIIVSLFYLLNYYYLQYQNQLLYNALQTKVLQSIPCPQTKEISKSPQPSSSNPKILFENYDLIIDFDELKKFNPHIYAWIYIPDTQINYPILQHPEDDSYYLNHNLDGQKGYPGCIYSEKYNQIDFSDAVTVLYGHSMNNGSMFGTLIKYENSDFLNKNNYLFIYTPKQPFKYEIILVAEYDNRHLLKSFNFFEQEGKTLFLKDILNTSPRFLTQNLDIHSTSQLLVLSTCLKTDSSKRLLIVAQKV
ncbi:hypothetical protein CS063_15750 [Sporanaerobium hydrogeniformans]|uniref:Uncharacterized protein n=1 Tax=Sporanaerobium hydrogeniformans TaxID=3072179 RepID=A0AC61D7E0_9FIRM|nr:class B sortase [Sporanaerobium hydrogeniformans]PHV69450.1 hypothetical protein CS063_15750 [Sporanaerobium hydrogeniformans]